jgi:two-component system, LytTR family, sensor kinase
MSSEVLTPRPLSGEWLFGPRAQSLILESGRQISRGKLFAILHWSGWLAFGAIPFVWTLRSWGLFGALLNNLLFVGIGSLVTLGLRAAYRQARQAKVAYTVLAPTVLVACAAVAEFWYLAELLAVRTSFKWLAGIEGVHAQFEFGARQLANAPLLIPLGAWFTYCFALLTWSSLYFGINSIMDLELEKTRVTSAMKLAEEARLRVMQAQLNPHFMFNALNGVATLIRENRGQTAANMVSTLSDYLRATLRTVNIPEITVSEELVFIDQYIELQQLRFSDLLRVCMNVDVQAYSALIPTLVLQPLVENAVQHGVLTQEHGGNVSISIVKQDERLIVSVEDDGPGPGVAWPPQFGVGLTNTSERLRTLYGDAASMSIGRSDGGGFAVRLQMPFKLDGKESAMTTRARA